MATRTVASVLLFLLFPSIAYSHGPQILLNRPSDIDHLYVMNSDDTQLRQLTNSQDDAARK